MAKARLKNLRAYSKRKGYDQTDFGIPLDHVFSDEGEDNEEDMYDEEEGTQAMGGTMGGSDEE